ncbi:uncharacterized protein LOC110695344 [Chenopodium quinoa]|uniref:uncharacterized protein LOC110695344 n=1 Tax=Chenopodium quinoa TaxID=63459 RepID=UPI000B791EB7|nr:uncharacterized protein LOC110695344 [Chenopodium quinoa]
MIEETMKQVRIIQANMKAAQDQQKSYADHNRRIVEFEVGEKALLKVLPTKGVMRMFMILPMHVIQPETIELDETLTFEQRPVKILDTKMRSTRNKAVKLVKVLWSNQNFEEVTWEAEYDMKKRYPELFDRYAEFRGRKLLKGGRM